MPHVLGACGFLFFGCVRGAVPDTAVTADPDTPHITSASVECDTEDAEWTFSIQADAWTGNGQLQWTTDGDYLEKHMIYSEEGAADGTSERLGLDLDVVADWRDVETGSSTWFNCNTVDLTGILRIYTRTGGDEADCRAFGTAPERWSEWDLGVSCETLLE